MRFSFAHIILALVLTLVGFSLGQETYFNSHPTVWKDGEVLIWSLDADPALDVKEFCLSLRRFNAGIGDPKCRLLGEWERDSVALRYASWLNANMDPNLDPDYLRARHPAMQAKFQALEDKTVLYIAKNGDKLNIAVFDETASEPKAAGQIHISPDKISMGDNVANMFFDRDAKRRLSKEERQKLATEPDEYFQEVPIFKGWVGIGIGYSQAHIPLTPDDWTESHTKSTIRNYRVTKDSVSLWNFLDDSDPFFSVYAGGTWYDFIGLELIYRLAVHNMKTDPNDTVYKELDHWKFYQHEIGLNAMLSRNYKPLKWLDITPFAFLGFQYSFFVEDIGLKKKVKTPSKAYKTRIKFEEAYKGALIGAGSHFILHQHYGLGLRTGISSRGRDMYVDPSPDAGAQPSMIGGFTLDWFISAGLEYHWTL
ncbi:MAG: hypothetical protein MJY82_04905 [Fibrobacter sp.]|nr:hypothetical protein [Fibrobacter sp.]